VRNRLLVIVAAGFVVLGAGGALYYLSPSPSPESATAPQDVAPVASPTAAPATAAEAAPSPVGRPVAPTPAAPSPTPEAPPTTGTLVIESDVPDTSVFLDRVFLGTAPVTARDLTPGQHQLKLVATGYDSYAEPIDVEAGSRTKLVTFKDITLDASLAVTHKHAFGSCSGTLRATPQGLTYDTSNKSDAFTVALTDLDTFSVDYLEKNLRVKIKGGKTYNFTDPDGNVNRLYLFHEEVDKVRQRILGGRGGG